MVVRFQLKASAHNSVSAREYEDEFVKKVMEQDMVKTKKNFTAKRKELEKSNHRISELDGLFKHLHEDRL